jgi:hypothetical protein
MSNTGLVISVFSVAVFGCAFSPGPPGGEVSGAGGNAASGGRVGSGGHQAQGGSTGTGSGGSSNPGAGGDVGLSGTAGQAAGQCGQGNVSIMAVPPDILIVQDKSGSMDEDDGGSTCKNGCGANSKWSQITAALNMVVASTQSSINWGLKFFSDNDACDASGAPVVGVAAMNATAIAKAINATGPGGNTPTRDAITYGVSYLASLTDTNPKYLLLATDGLPNCPMGCSRMSNPSSSCTMTDNPSEDKAAEQAVAMALQQGFKTFVIGIGNVSSAVNTLNQLAMNGGEAQTSGATSYFAATDPTALESALTTIVGVVASCEISLAGAPTGFSNVAVSAQTTAGTTIQIASDPTNGWSYGPNNQSIILNGTSCTNLKNGTYSNFQFYYACPGTTIHIGAVLPR